ncbi:MAG: hypothetical protein JSW17_02990 [Candidatus Omnitrophota bacterium]|nr:MAG: hypothetical protein JSW17_02990 [Candidatus Omnitrophota bacterium]
MPYNQQLDECLFTKAWEGEATRLTVSVYSYNKGPKKLQIVRENKDTEGNFRFTRLGRISKEELEAILPLIKEAQGNLE